MNDTFKKLLHLDCGDKIEKKNNLSYLSWSFAWSEVLKNCKDAAYEIKKFDNNLPYVFDENTGYMVFTSVTIEGITHEMWLPVMDGANKAMKDKEYTYSTRYGDKKVAPATMFDINKTIMRCLVKNLAMFGLGLYIYAGEDLPEEDEQENEKHIIDLKSCKTVDELGKMFKSLPANKQKALSKLVTELKLELSNGGK